MTCRNFLMVRRRWCSWRAILFVLALSLVVPSAQAADDVAPCNRNDQHLITTSTSRPSYLRLVIPASESNDNLCKTLVSAAILDYSTPTIVNWDKIFNDEKLIFGGSHIAKIQGVLNYLNTLRPQDDDDLILVVDGYDVWFQLRPNVMLDRYQSINARAGQRISRHLGPAGSTYNISQRVLFSAQKRCWPKEADHPACWAVPESSLPADVYGSETDTDVGDMANPFVKYRQRYLNSGMTLGPVRDVRAIFTRALEKVKIDQGFGSDQGIFAEIFGEQEYNRHRIAALHKDEPSDGPRVSFLTKLAKYLGMGSSSEPSPAPLLPSGEPARLDAPIDLSLEFGIGLDYESRILQTTVFSEYDTAWVNFSDSTSLETALHNVEGAPPDRLQRLSEDITRSKPPFSTLRKRPFPSGSLPRELSWNQVSLFANVWTGTAPVAIHHNAHRNGLKSRIQTHWNRTWFQPYARPLMDAHVIEPREAIATSLLSDGSVREYWSESSEKGVIQTDDGSFRFYDKFCENSWDELFQDGNGPWEDPRFGFV